MKTPRERAVIDEAGRFSPEAAAEAATRRMLRKAPPSVEHEEEEPAAQPVHRVERSIEPEEDDQIEDTDSVPSLENQAYAKAAKAHASWADTDMAKLAARRWDTAEAYWTRVNQLLDSKLEAQAIEKTKRAKQDSIGAGAASHVSGQPVSTPDADDAARELSRIQAGEFGSPSSPANKAKREKLRAILRSR